MFTKIGSFASTMLRTKYIWPLYCETHLPKFVSMGTADQFTSANVLEEKIKQSKSPVEVKIYKDNHFWLSCASQMAQDAVQWALQIQL